MVLVATQVKRRRGTNDENDAFAGVEGEITVDLTNKELRVHDGSGKTGGFRIGRHTDRGNCTIEVPQNIKLELSNGTLTLKAGSKVYVPNGSGVFNVVNIANDLTRTDTSNGEMTLYVNATGTSLSRYSTGSEVSGTTEPTGSNTFYNTSTNTINRYNSGVKDTNLLSFPICHYTVSGGQITSIDQVFNGFGHIGSTRFVLPDVIALAPNGRNADGTPKNIVCKSSSVWVATNTDGTAKIVMFGNLGLATNRCFNTNYFVQKTEPITNSVLSWWYNPETNIISKYDGTKWVAGIWVELAQYDTTSSIIRNMSVKTVFRAVDYNDTEYMAHQAMPSDRYTDLTLPASDGTITAPADGSLYFNKVSSASGQRIKLNNKNGTEASVSSWSSATSQALEALLLVSKGDVIRVNYNAGGTTNYFRFIYANGAK